MAVDPDPHYPGPAALGRGVVVSPGVNPPEGFPADAPRVRIDDDVVAHPSPAVARLHLAWVRREPVVIELAADNAELRQPETTRTHPWQLPHGFTFERERLHFLTWANTYDARSGEPIWWHGELARRRGGEVSRVADVRIDGDDAWADGGPRGPVSPSPGDRPHHELDGIGLVHRESIQLGRLRLLGDPRAEDEVDAPDGHATPAQSPATAHATATTHATGTVNPLAAKPAIGLADDQQAAVAHAAGPARIIAPAGSGKTRVLTARMRHLVATLGFEPELVTAVAYNTRAAAEMRTRLGHTSKRSVRTFHSLGKWICDLERRREVIDERQQRAILDRLVTTGRVPNTDPFQAYLDALALVRLGLVDPIAAGTMHELDDFDQTFHDYRTELDRRGLIDFDEMVYHALELLVSNPDLRDRVTQRGTHLLVDEFQDLTPAFHLLMRLVAGPSLQVFGVGDDDQVIYGYAGANPDYLIDFARDFPGAGDHPLTTNWRCPPGVVTQVATLLAHNRRRVHKAIEPGRDVEVAARSSDADVGEVVDAGQNADVGEVAVHAVDTGAMAARTVSLVQDRITAGADPEDIAVLARVNATLLPVQVSLALADVAHTKVLDVGVLQRTGIRTALAYLRLGLDPERMTRADIMETLNRPSRKVKSAVKDHLRGRRFSFDRLAAISEVLSNTHAGRWDDYLDDIMALSNAITEGASTAGCLSLIRSRIGLGAAMATLDSSRSRPEGSSHGDDLDALAQLAVLQPQPVEFGPWLHDQLALPGDENGVTLSTVHRVKGMEWDHVVVYAATDGLMPHRLAEDVEEERRVFHVAVTRCRDSVAVVGDRGALSPFVADLQSAATPREAADDTSTDDTPARIVDNKVAADPGVKVCAPGGVTATVRTTLRTATGTRVELDVDGAEAWLAMGAPVWVDGQRGELGPATPSRTRAGAAGRTGGSGRTGDDPMAGVSRLEAWRRQREDRLASNGDDGSGRDDVELNAAGQARFEELRTWRTDKARELAMPPYIVFNDKALTAIAAANPTDLAELSGCHGVGPTKLDRWGDEILELLDDPA